MCACAQQSRSEITNYCILARNETSTREHELWHSKADKIVNNFHGQNRFQFHGQTPIFMVKTLIFVVKTDVQTYKFS